MTNIVSKMFRHLDPRHDFDHLPASVGKTSPKRFTHIGGVVYKSAARGGTVGGLAGAFYDAALGTGDGQGLRIGILTGLLLDNGQIFFRHLIRTLAYASQIKKEMLNSENPQKDLS
jgi:hypothetical protein